MRLHNEEFARRLRSKKLCLGLLVKMPDAAMIELAGHLGFDFVIIDTEHGSGDYDQLQNHLRAADGVGLPSLVRIAAESPATVGRVLDAGAAGVIFPHVDSAEKARLTVQAAHYPPVGMRGLATSTRAGGHGTVPADEHMRRAARTTLVIAQIEDIDGVPHAAAIASTPGIDGVWIGPNDLALSMERPRSDPAVAMAEQRIADGVHESAAALAVLAAEPADVLAWRERGASMMIFPAPTVLAPALAQLLRESRAAAPSVEPEPGDMVHGPFAAS